MSTTLDHQMAAVLVRLELVSHGATQAWNASGGHSGEPDDKMVAMVVRGENPPHLSYRLLYERQGTDVGRMRIIESAEAELRTWTHRSQIVVTKTKTLDQLVIEDGEGWEPVFVGRRFGISEAHVRRIRGRANRGTEDGREPKPVITPDVMERARRARELRDKGLSLRQIALHLKCGVGTVSRDLAA